jgi:hypothetical protein
LVFGRVVWLAILQTTCLNIASKIEMVPSTEIVIPGGIAGWGLDQILITLTVLTGSGTTYRTCI